MQLEHVKDSDTNLAWVAKFHMNFIMKLLRHYSCSGIEVYKCTSSVTKLQQVSHTHAEKKILQNNSLVSDTVEWEFKVRKMKISYYLKCACIYSKTANLLRSTQLKHYIEWKRLRQWRTRLYTKLKTKTCQRWTSQQRASSCCQAVECKDGVLIMVDTEWLQTCPVLSEWSQGTIFSLGPSLPAQALFSGWGGQWDISVHTEGIPPAPLGLSSVGPHEFAAWRMCQGQCNIQTVMWEENLPEVTFLRFGCCHGPLEWSKEQAYVKIKTVQEIRSGRAKDDRKSQQLHASTLFFSDVVAEAPFLCVHQFLNLMLLFPFHTNY